MKRRSAPKAFRAVVLSAAVALLTAFSIFLFSYLLFPVQGVRVEGARMFPESDLRQAVPGRASLLTLNVEALERRAKANPWVKRVEVSRNWESGIVTVKVEERRAVLNADVDGRNEVYAADGTKLPGLGGAGLSSVEVDRDQVEEILKAGRVFESNGVSLDSIDGVDAGGVEATVEGRRVVFSGRVSAGQVRALPEIMARHPEAERFDLRSPERVVVGGKTGTGV